MNPRSSKNSAKLTQGTSTKHKHKQQVTHPQTHTHPPRHFPHARFPNPPLGSPPLTTLCFSLPTWYPYHIPSSRQEHASQRLQGRETGELPLPRHLAPGLLLVPWAAESEHQYRTLPTSSRSKCSDRPAYRPKVAEELRRTTGPRGRFCVGFKGSNSRNRKRH